MTTGRMKPINRILSAWSDSGVPQTAAKFLARTNPDDPELQSCIRKLTKMSDPTAHALQRELDYFMGPDDITSHRYHGDAGKNSRIVVMRIRGVNQLNRYHVTTHMGK